MNNLDLYGIALALAAAVIAYWRGQGNSKGYLAALAVLGGSSLAVILYIRFQQVPSIEDNIIKRTEKSEEIILNRTQKLEDNLSLSTKYINHPMAMTLLSEYVTATDVVNQNKSTPFFDEYFSKRRERYLEGLRDAQKGQYRILKSEIPVFANQVLEKAAKSVFATSYVKSIEWWDTPWGRRYEELNYRKVKAGVRITRFFLFANEADLNKARGLLSRQVANGVQVYVVNPNDTADTYWNDIIIVDDSFGGELLLTPEKTIREVVMYTRKYDIRRLRDTVDALRARAVRAERILQGGSADHQDGLPRKRQ